MYHHHELSVCTQCLLSHNSLHFVLNAICKTQFLMLLVSSQSLCSLKCWKFGFDPRLLHSSLLFWSFDEFLLLWSIKNVNITFHLLSAFCGQQYDANCAEFGEWDTIIMGLINIRFVFVLKRMMTSFKYYFSAFSMSQPWMWFATCCWWLLTSKGSMFSQVFWPAGGRRRYYISGWKDHCFSIAHWPCFLTK